MQITVTVNGVAQTRDVEPRLLLVHFLRDELGLTGTHWSCDTSNCGACVVQYDGAAGQVVHGVRRDGAGPRGPHRRGARQQRRARPRPAGVQRLSRPAVRVLHPRDDAHRSRPARREPGPVGPRDPRGDLRPDLPVHRLREHRPLGPRGRPGRARRARGSREGARQGDHDALRRRHHAHGLRLHAAQGGRAVRPRPRPLPRRHRAAGDAARRGPAQPVRPREDPLGRHQRRRGAPEGQGRDHRRDARRAGPVVDADAVARRPGRARHGQGALPGPGGRVRHRDRPLRGARRARPHRGRLRAAAPGRRREAGSGPRRPGDPRRPRGPHRQPHLRLGGRRPGGHGRGVRRGGRRLVLRDALPARAPGADGDLRRDRLQGRGHRQDHDLDDHAGAARAPHDLRAGGGAARARDPGDRPGHRRRVRQQGRHLPRLRLRGRRHDPHRCAGEVDRRPHREPHEHVVRPRLPHAGRDRGHEGRQAARGAGEGPRGPRRVQRHRADVEDARGAVPRVQRLLRHAGGALLGDRRLHEQVPGRRGVRLLVPDHRGRVPHRAARGRPRLRPGLGSRPSCG